MILSIAMAMLQTEPAQFLVVDGFVVGMYTKGGWSKPSAGIQPFSADLSPVGIGTIQSGSTTVHVVPNRDSSALVSQEKLPAGVFYSGEVARPRQSRVLLQRGASMASAAQFVRQNGFLNPRPYLLNVYEVDGQYELITATSKPPALLDGRGPGEWEAVILRWKDKVYPLSVSFPKVGEKLSQCRLRAIGDFDGDGQVEFLTSCNQPSLKCTTLWSFRDGKLMPVLDVSYEVNS